MRRTIGLLAALAALTLILAAGGATGRAATTSGQLLGTWTPDSGSNAQLGGHAFHIASASEGSARSAAGSFPSSFDQYCKSGGAGVGQATYFVLSYSWASSGTMGGCVSDQTKNHLYLWGSHDDLAYLRPIVLQGEQLLSGGWGLYQNPSVNYEKLKAHHPSARFVVKAKATSGKKSKRTVSSVEGTGGLHVADAPASCVSTAVLSGNAPLLVSVTKGRSKLLALKVRWSSAGGTYESCGSQSTLKGIPVFAWGVNKYEKVACPKGSTGQLSLTDKAGADAVAISIPACHLSLSISQTKKGSKASVAVTYDQNGY